MTGFEQFIEPLLGWQFLSVCWLAGLIDRAEDYPGRWHIGSLAVGQAIVHFQFVLHQRFGMGYGPRRNGRALGLGMGAGVGVGVGMGL